MGEKTSPVRKGGKSGDDSRLQALDRKIARKQSEIEAAKEAAREARATPPGQVAARAAQARKRSGGARGKEGSARLRKLDQEVARKQSELREARAERLRVMQAKRAEEDENAAEATKPPKPAARTPKPPAKEAKKAPARAKKTPARAARGAGSAVKRTRQRADARRQAGLEQRAKAREAALQARAERRGLRPPADANGNAEAAGATASAEPATKPPKPESKREPITIRQGSGAPSHLGRRIAIAAAVLAIPAAVGLGAGALTAEDSPAAPVESRPAETSTQYAEALEREVDDLSAARKAGLERLSKADTRAGQAVAAGNLADSHREAADAFAAISVPDAVRASRQDLVAACNAVAGTYGALSAAAAKRDEGDYRDAQSAVLRAERTLDNTLQRIGRQAT